MDKWAAALTAIGGLAGIGGLIDLAMYKSEKDKLKALLEDWWLRFTDVRWSNFGRAEAELAIQILDRWAGSRLWSWKRWLFSVKVTMLVLAIIATWMWARFPEEDISFGSVLFLPQAIVLGPSIVALFLSLSLTRFIAVAAARLCRGPRSSVTVFTALLSLHVLLLWYWSAIVLMLKIVGIAILFLLGSQIGLTPLNADAVHILLRDAHLLWDWVVSERQDWRPLFGLHPEGPVAIISFNSFTMAMDLVANGLRIALALVFLGSFVFRPLIQEPLSRIWYGAINSGKPTFTMLFGAIGTLVAAGQALAK